MKKLGILALILIILSAGAYFLIQKTKSEEKGIVIPDREFALESFDKVEKIILKHPLLQPLQFNRVDGTWIINGRYGVDPSVFVGLEKAMTGMKLLYIPPVASNKTVQKSVKENGIRVEVYEEGGSLPSKVYYVGSDTQKSDGTHMIMEGAEQAYVMHLPGLAGGLRSRFEQPEKNFRDPFIYQDNASDIASIKVEYPKSELSSFIIDNTNKEPTVMPINKSFMISGKNINPRFVQSYISQFEKKGAEGLINDSMDKDSVLIKIPYCIIEMKRKDGKVKKNVFYGYEDYIERNINSRNPADIEKLNRLYVWSDDSDFYIVQVRVFGDLFVGYQDFFR